MQVGYYRLQTKLGQGNIFRSMCQEFCSWGGAGSRGMPDLGRVSGPGRLPGPSWGLLPGGAWRRPPPRTATAAGSTHPTGMHSC